MRFSLAACVLLALAPSAFAQTPPEIAYVSPPCAAPGQTIDVKIGGYNWTPDMQIFVLDPRVKLEIVGPPGPVIVPEPPYWFGKKARDNDLPLAREFPAKLTIAADCPPGLVQWQAANANGAAPRGVILVAPSPDVVEKRIGSRPQKLPALPASVVGQLQRLEEIDRYTFTASRAGPVTLEVWTRRLKTKMNAVVEVRDPTGRVVADGADTAGHDLQITFAAQAGTEYTASVYDVDFRGYRQFTYRLAIHEGPRVTAAVPAGGLRGQTRPIEFFGYGIATGQPILESVTKDVAFPADPALTTFSYKLETAFGPASPISLTLSDREEIRRPAAGTPLTLPVTLTGVLDARYGEDRFPFAGKKGDVLTIDCRSVVQGQPLDPSVAVLDAMGKEIVRADDVPGTTDASLVFPVPADGQYFVAVSDSSGMSGSRDAAYRLSIEPQAPDFALTLPEILSVPLGGKAPLPVKVTRQGAFKGPVTLALSGLPVGVTPPADLTVAEAKADMPLELSCAADAAVTAGMLTVTATAMHEGKAISHPAQVLVAITMKPRVKLTPEGLDDVRKWPRGSTYPAPVLIERLEGYAGPVILEQTAAQQRTRQGITGPDFQVPPGVTRAEYPVFLPEWLETTKTSRILLNGVVQVPDPKGTVRHLVNKMELRIGMLPVGAMLKLVHAPAEYTAAPGQPFEVPVTLIRSGELGEPAKLELVLPEELAGQLAAEPMTASKAEATVKFRIQPVAGQSPQGEYPITIRATVLHQGKLPVVSETTVDVLFTAPVAQK